MEKIFEAANRYVAESDWKTIAVLKFCLISLGMMIGMFIKKEHRRPVMIGALCVFAVTYAPLMAKFSWIFTEEYMKDFTQQED